MRQRLQSQYSASLNRKVLLGCSESMKQNRGKHLYVNDRIDVAIKPRFDAS